jgi:hypothetical protein
MLQKETRNEHLDFRQGCDSFQMVHFLQNVVHRFRCTAADTMAWDSVIPVFTSPPIHPREARGILCKMPNHTSIRKGTDDAKRGLI